MIEDAPLLAGMLIGLSVAAPIGPLGILCIQRTLSSGMAVGVSTGLGATAMQLSYATLFLLGLRDFGPELVPAQRMLGFGGGLALVILGLRLLRRRLAVQSMWRPRAGSMLAAFTSATVLNACNPLLLLLLVGAITSIAGPNAAHGQDTARLLLGLAVGSSAWWVVLSGGAAALRSRLSGPVLDALNRISAASLLGFGVLAISRAIWF